MWLGLLPVRMFECQANYYLQIGSRKSAKNGFRSCSKMLQATHGLWVERNNILHLRAAKYIRGLNNIALKTAVSQQYNLGHKGMEEVFLST